MSNAVIVDIKGKNDGLKSALGGSESMIKGFGTKMVAAFAAVGAGIAAAMSVKMVFDWGKSFVEAAAEAQEAEAKLSAVLDATGHAAGFTTQQLVDLSSQLQQVTKFEAETTQEAMGIIATFKNIRGDIFVEATKSAQDMATVLGTDLNGAAMQLGKALNDPVKGLAALSRSGVSFNKEQEELINTLVKSGDVMGAQKIILQELQSEFGGAAEKVGGTFSGKMEIMKNRFGDIAESIGEMLIPMLEALIPLVDGFATMVENIIPTVKIWSEIMLQTGKDIFAAMQPVFDWLIDAGVTVFTALQIVVEDFSEATNIAIDAWVLHQVKQYEIAKYYLEEVLPAALKWLADNWYNILVDLGNFQITIFTNMIGNIDNFITAIKDSLSGRGADFKFYSLLDGFEMTISEFPKLAGRVQGELEKELEAKLADRAGAAFNDRFAKNKQALLDMFKAKDLSDIDLSNTADTTFDAGMFTTKDDAKEKKEKAKKEKKEKEAKEQGAQFEDLESLNKRIQAAAAGTGSDPAKMVAETNEELIDVGNRLFDQQKTLVDTIEDLDASINDDLMETMEKISEPALDDIDLMQEQNGLLGDIKSLLDEEKILNEQVKESNDVIAATIGDVGKLY